MRQHARLLIPSRINLHDQEWQEKLTVAERMHKFELEQLHKLLVSQTWHHTFICHRFLAFAVPTPYLVPTTTIGKRAREDCA